MRWDRHVERAVERSAVFHATRFRFSQETIEDVTQDAKVKVWQAIQSGKIRTRNVIDKTVLNLVRDQRDKHGRMPKTVPLSYADSVASQYEGAETWLVVLDYIEFAEQKFPGLAGVIVSKAINGNYETLAGSLDNTRQKVCRVRREWRLGENN